MNPAQQKFARKLVFPTLFLGIRPSRGEISKDVALWGGGISSKQVQKFLRLGVCTHLPHINNVVITIACNQVGSNGLLNNVCGRRVETVNKKWGFMTKNQSKWERRFEYEKSHYFCT